MLIVSDPDFLQELFVGKAKYVDKFYRSKTLFYIIFGESIILDKTTQL